jgi:hypothetical protein
MRCSRRIIANLGSRELDVISALVRASASTSDGDPSRLFMESEALKEPLRRCGPDTLISPVTGRPAHPLCGKRALPGQAEHSTLLQSVPTFREVMDFRTSARLVVPSACESGLGAQNRGEGIQGLTRAGCLPGRVVASQWRVDDDATAEVMAALYLALLGHASGLPTQFRIGLSSRPIRGSCETRISSPR